MSFSCKGCNDRKVGCHSYCEKYKKEKEEHNKMKETERKVKSVDNYFRGRAIKCTENSANKKNWKKVYSYCG